MNGVEEHPIARVVRDPLCLAGRQGGIFSWNNRVILEPPSILVNVSIIPLNHVGMVGRILNPTYRLPDMLPIAREKALSFIRGELEQDGERTGCRECVVHWLASRRGEIRPCGGINENSWDHLGDSITRDNGITINLRFKSYNACVSHPTPEQTYLLDRLARCRQLPPK